MGAFAAILFGAAFLAAIWTLVTSIRPQVSRIAALLRPASTLPALPPRPNRIMVRAVPAQPPKRLPLRAAA